MYTAVFDGLYWAFGAVMLVALVATIARSAAGLRRSIDRSRSRATLGIAIGALIVLIVGFALNALRDLTGDLVYQQIHFAAFYVAFGLVLWGFDQAGMAAAPAAVAGRLVRPAVWGAFGIAVVLALIGLLSPDSYKVIGSDGISYVQEPLFFLPVFVVLLVGAASLPSWLDAGRRHTVRPWLAAVATFMLVGMLREATIIASTDQPIVDLALAFVPFTLASLCLYRAASLGVSGAPAPSVAWAGRRPEERTP